MNTNLLKCEVCKSTNIVPVLDLGDHPLCDDLVRLGGDNKCEEFPIEIAFCKDCLTALQIHQVPKRKLFPDSYHYRSSMTQDVLNGMQGLVEKIKTTSGSLAGLRVVDIGCNDGSLLKIFKSEGAQVYGIEPTSAAHDAVANGIEVLNDYFDPASARSLVTFFGNPDFVTFTNVFAHIENIDELLESVSILMGVQTRLVVENHYLGAVLDRCQFDTFYHEHPRTYSLTSFVKIAERLGRSIESFEFPSRYGGNIRVVIGPGQPATGLEQAIAGEQGFVQKFLNMEKVIERWILSRDSILAKVRCENGKVYGKAFPGRAAILIKLLQLTDKDITAVFEKPGSQKIGHYIPGTRIPIVSDDTLLSTVPSPRKLLNLAWHIQEEIERYLKSMDPEIECLSIFSDKDANLVS